MNTLPFGTMREILNQLVETETVDHCQWSCEPIEFVPLDIVHVVAHNGAVTTVYQNVVDDSQPIAFEQYDGVEDIASPWHTAMGEVAFGDLEDFLLDWAADNELVEA